MHLFSFCKNVRDSIRTRDLLAIRSNKLDKHRKSKLRSQFIKMVQSLTHKGRGVSLMAKSSSPGSRHFPCMKLRNFKSYCERLLTRRPLVMRFKTSKIPRGPRNSVLTLQKTQPSTHALISRPCKVSNMPCSWLKAPQTSQKTIRLSLCSNRGHPWRLQNSNSNKRMSWVPLWKRDL